MKNPVYVAHGPGQAPGMMVEVDLAAGVNYEQQTSLDGLTWTDVGPIKLGFPFTARFEVRFVTPLSPSFPLVRFVAP